MENVEIIQYQAALAITDAWQGSSLSKIYDELGWETLADRRQCRRVLQIHKIIKNNTPSSLKDKLLPNCREMFSGNIRTTFRAIICKSNRYMNSFFPHAIASWNIFMEIFNYKDVPSIGVLKKDIISLISPESKSFGRIHDPVGIRYLFQLRVSLSPLKGRKFYHNFIDTSSGTCHCNQGIEDTRHCNQGIEDTRHCNQGIEDTRHCNQGIEDTRIAIKVSKHTSLQSGYRRHTSLQSGYRRHTSLQSRYRRHTSLQSRYRRHTSLQSRYRRRTSLQSRYRRRTSLQSRYRRRTSLQSRFKTHVILHMLFRELIVWQCKWVFTRSQLKYLENQLQLFIWHPSINDSDNKKLLLLTIKFIKETQRF